MRPKRSPAQSCKRGRLAGVQATSRSAESRHTPPARRIARPRFLGEGVPEPGIGGCKDLPASQFAQRTEVIWLAGSPRRAGAPARATALSDWLSFLVLPSALRPTTSDTRFRFVTPAPTLRLTWERRPSPARP